MLTKLEIQTLKKEFKDIPEWMLDGSRGYDANEVRNIMELKQSQKSAPLHPEHGLLGREVPLEQWEDAVFRNYAYFNVFRFTGPAHGSRRCATVKTYPEAIKVAGNDPQTLIYVVAKSERFMAIGRRHWQRFYEIWNAMQLEVLDEKKLIEIYRRAKQFPVNMDDSNSARVYLKKKVGGKVGTPRVERAVSGAMKLLIAEFKRRNLELPK